MLNRLLQCSFRFCVPVWGARVLFWLCLSFSGGIYSQDSSEAFEKKSLQLRTALHYDPLLPSALEGLVRLYEEVDRVDELVALYQGHVQQYPEDAGAKAVLIRLYELIEREDRDEQLRIFVQTHPDSSELIFLLYESLKEKADPRASATLSQAISIQVDLIRKQKWTKELLARSETEQERELAAPHLEEMIAIEELSSAELIRLATLAQRFRFWELSLGALNRIQEEYLDPESSVETQVLISVAERETGQGAKASSRLAAVLGRLAPDHWRRAEVLSMRIQALQTVEERKALLDQLAAAHKQNPESESALLDYAEVLIALNRKKQAARVLVEGSRVIDDSSSLESKTMELLLQLADYKSLGDFLKQQLESHPSRSDLRYELVKVQYRQGQVLNAQQDFDAVLAGLSLEDAAGRKLELARFLRNLNLQEETLPIYRAFLEKRPYRLDVARELLEIFLESEARKEAEVALSATTAKGAELENILDLTQYLVEEEFYFQARRLLSEALADAPEQFELGLRLVRVLGESGDQAGANKWIEQVRPQADTPTRYRQWLQTSLRAHGLFENAARFFDSEQNRYSYSGAEWNEELLERFLILCEQGEENLLKKKVTQAIRNLLAGDQLDEAGETRLNLLLVRSLEGDPSQAAELETLLTDLSERDPTHRANYELKRALLYHRSQRVDLAREILAAAEFQDITDLNLMREVVPIFLEYELVEGALAFLRELTRREARDLLSWEALLSVLAAVGNEKDFRAVVRKLIEETPELKLRKASRDALATHFTDSCWRSVATILAHQPESEWSVDAFPILALVDDFSERLEDHLWVEWIRAYLYSKSGKMEEAENSRKWLQERLEATGATLRFPDGLEIGSVSAALALATASDGSSPKAPPGESVFAREPEFRWAFEVEPGAQILRHEATPYGILVLDDRGNMHLLDEASGKLRWKENLGVPQETKANPGAFAESSASLRDTETDALEKLRSARLVRPLGVGDREFYLISGTDLLAYTIQDCRLKWRASLSFLLGQTGRTKSVNTPGALPGIQLAVGESRLVVFAPLTGKVSGFERKSGKMLWEHHFTIPESEALESSRQQLSLNSGISLAGQHVFVYGINSAVLEIDSGKEIWQFSEDQVTPFPITLREERTEQVNPSEDSNTNEERKWWQNSKQEGEEERRYYDYLFVKKGERRAPLSTFLRESVSLVSPAVHWSQQRNREGSLASGELRDGSLWLMSGGGVRDVSLTLPVSSQRLAVRGSYLGQRSGHLWFLDKGELLHSDFRHEEVTRHSLEELGDPRHLSGGVFGAQVIVSGRQGMQIYHAQSGQKIAQWAWREPFLNHLNQRVDAKGSGRSEKIDFVWQGKVLAREGLPSYCYPLTGKVKDGVYYGIFAQRMIAAVSAKGQKEPETVVPAETP